MSEEITLFSQEECEEENTEQKYFKIAEASDLLGVKPHVLRYWESEFPQIRPYKSKNGQRLYRRRDFEALKHVQRLLYQERCTIAAARQALRQILEKEAQEASVADQGEPTLEVVAPVEMQFEIEEPRQIAQIQTPMADVLEIVEQKVARNEIRESLLLAQAELRELLTLLAA